MNKNKINIETVASKAGLSRATVSRVIRNYPGVKEKTRRRVEEAIKELNYEVNIIARNLRQNKTNTIGIIFGKVFDLFFSTVVKSIENVANKAGYSVILCDSDDDPKKEMDYLRMLNALRVDGIILIPTGMNKKYIKNLIDKGIRIVLLDRTINGMDCSAVLVDNYKGGYLAAKHLIEQGYKKIAIINGSTELLTGRERLKGYIAALKEKNIDTVNELIKNRSFDKEFGSKATEELLSYGVNKPDAIFTTNLDLTLGALKKLDELKINIPGQIGIVGLDNADWCVLIKPKLTVIDYPLYQFGATAADLLLRKINNKNVKDSIDSTVIKLDTYINIRESSIRKL